VAGLLSCWVVGLLGFGVAGLRGCAVAGSRAWNVARAATGARKPRQRGECRSWHGPIRPFGHLLPARRGEKGNKPDSRLRGCLHGMSHAPRLRPGSPARGESVARGTAPHPAIRPPSPRSSRGEGQQTRFSVAGSRAWNVARAATEARKPRQRGECRSWHGPIRPFGHLLPARRREKGNKPDSWLRGHAANGERGRNAIAAMRARASRAMFVHGSPWLLLQQGGFLAGRMGVLRRRGQNDDHTFRKHRNVRQSCSSRSAASPCRSVTHAVSQCDQPASQRDAHRVAVRPARVAARHTPCRSATSPRRSATHTVSQCDQPASQRDAHRVAVRPPRVAARQAHVAARQTQRPIATNPASRCDKPTSWCDNPASQCDKPRRSATNPASQCDNPASRATNPASRATNPRRGATRSISRCIAPPSLRAQKQSFATPLTSRRGEPILTGYNLRLERVEGLAANGSTRS